MTDRRVILYGYRQSPYYRKTQLLLAHYGVPYDTVKTDMMPPRPMLSDELGITYRRIPVLALDGELYIDTSAIARKLDETFGAGGNAPSLLAVQPEMQRRLVLHWSEGILFGLAASLIPVKAVTPEFIKDRQSFNNGRPLIGRAEPAQVHATLTASLHSLDTILAQSSTGWIMGSPGPQYADISTYFILDWLQTGQRSAPDLLPLPGKSGTSQPLFPNVLKWLDEARQYLKQRTAALPAPRELNPTDAARHITATGARAAEAAGRAQQAVSRDDPLVKAGRLAFGDDVLVAPTDAGKVPQKGTLCALSPTGISILVEAGPNSGRKPVLTHFPRNNFGVVRTADVPPPASKL